MNVEAHGVLSESTSATARIAQLRIEHSELDARLQRLNRTVHLTTSEQLEVRQIKRMKLRAKDRIHYLTRLDQR